MAKRNDGKYLIIVEFKERNCYLDNESYRCKYLIIVEFKSGYAVKEVLFNVVNI